MTKLLMKYKFFLSLVILNLILMCFFPKLGSKSIEISISNLIEMLIIVPPIFLLLGLFDIWVPRETIIKLMGEKSGPLGIVLSLTLGSFSAGPLYAAFPVAAVLIQKGCKFSNIILFVGAWATTKIPMLLFEAGAMGWHYMVTRLIINVFGVILMAYLVEIMIPRRDKELFFEGGSSL